MVSPWMQNGNVLEYMEKNKKADKLQLMCVSVRERMVVSDQSKMLESARGLEYLHAQLPALIHGDIKGVSLFGFFIHTISKPVTTG